MTCSVCQVGYRRFPLCSLWKLFSICTKDFAASLYFKVNLAAYNYYSKGINKDTHLLINKLAFQSVIYDVKFGLPIVSGNRSKSSIFRK